MNLFKRFGYIFSLLFTLTAFGPSGFAQQNLDITTLNVDELSDDQIAELVQRANEAGLSTTEFLQMAEMRGLSGLQAEKLKTRIEELNLGKGVSRATPVSKRDPRKQVDLSVITQGLLAPQANLEEGNSRIFGANLFYQKNRRLSFEPNLNQATPTNYILGPGDILYIDIYGQSEKYYEATVNPDGFVLLDNIGPVSVSGKSIEDATGIIKSRVSKFYPGLSGSNPSTFLQVTLGNVRTIKVHILGEVRLPGTFTLSAFSSVFNALYAAGGPNENGSLRAIKLVRKNQTIAEIDVYELLTKGAANLDLQLQDQDVLLIPPYLARTEINGEVKRPLIFEIKPEETLSQLLSYAGGFTDEAFRERISISRITGTQRSVSDVMPSQFGLFILKGGDEITVGKILNRYSNRVQIKGAVYRQGVFALTEGMTLTQLIQQAEGLKGDAFTDRASILRTKEDLSSEVLEVNLNAILSGQATDIMLKREDVIRISSKYELQNERYVQIFGEVKRPGTYPFAEGLTPEELILMAGGLQESANTEDVEIARRLEDEDLGTLAELIPVKVNADLSINENSPELMAFDQLIVRKRADFSRQKLVTIEGQVNSPGMFAIQNSGERISDLIRRAGGINRFAYAKGATLIRKTEFFNTESEQIRRRRNLESLRMRLLEDPNNSEAQEELLQRLFKDLPVIGKSDSAGSFVKREALDQLAEGNAGLEVKIKETEVVAINLEKILQNPGSEEDLLLEEGDILSIPKVLQTVRMRGDVVYPTTLRHENGKGLRHYIDGAGGFERRANRKQTYVVYANGAVKRTKSFIGIKAYPPVEPGAEVIVPTKGPKLPLRLGDVVGITTGLATLALVISQINWTP